MTSDEQNALRTMLREEVNAAVYASEQRLGEYLGRIEGDLTKVKADLTQVVSILDEVTIQILTPLCRQISISIGKWLVQIA